MLSKHRELARERVIIIAAPNGARRTRADHAAVPITPAELADSAQALVAEGVSVLHLHVRDENERHTLDAERYRAAIEAVRGRVDDRLIVQITTEAVGRYTAAEQMRLVRDLRPEAVSLALRELCPTEADEPEAAEFFAWLNAEKIWPQYILYTAEEVARFDALRARGVFADSAPFALFVLGRYAENLTGDLTELDAMLAAADCSAFPWAVCCFGATEHAAVLEAARRGGHARLGFENNLVRADGTTAADNAQLIADFTRALTGTGRKPAGADDIRAALVRD